jgi:WD40 repeat protein
MTLAVDEARAGVRAWVREAGRRTASALRTATPYGIVAFLAASAVAPIAGAALGAPAELGATLNQLGGMGGNFLSDALVDTARRLRNTDASTEQWRDAIAAELLSRLEAGDERAAALSDELAALLHSVDAVGIALRAADDRQQETLALAFAALGEDVGRMQILAADAVDVLTAMRQQLAGQGRALAVQTDMLRQSLTLAAQLQQEVRRRLPAVDPATPTEDPQPLAYDGSGVSPYPGLTSFQSTDAGNFHGREALVGELLGRLSEQLVGGPPLVVVGVSGVGKSSLLHAGVLPAIAAGGLGPDSAAWPWLLMTPGPTPLAELTARAATIAGADPDSVPEDPRSFGALAARAGGDGRLVIVVDQFEELFTQCDDPAERAAFAEALAAAAPALVLIAVRADFYPQCTELPAMVPMLGAGQVVAGPLRTGELRRAVRDPATGAGLALEPGLEELLLTDLGALAGESYEPGALPLLAHALRATWARRTGTTMTVAGYRETGGIRHAVADTAERIYIGLSGADRDALRSALLALVTVVDDRTVRHRATPAEVNVGVLRPMIDARLVTAGRDAVQISHEALLTSWPRLANWLTEAREEILLRRRLAQAAEDWSAAGADPDALYRGARLATAREWAAGRTDVPEAQQRFLTAGAEAAEAEQLAQQRGARRLRRLVAGLAAALLLAVAGGLVALDQRGDAETNLRTAQSRRLALQSRTVLLTDQLSAVRSALEAWGTAHTTEARSALLSAQQANTLGHLGDEPRANAVATSPDGRRVAVGYYGGRIQLWDAGTLRQIGGDLMHPTDKLISLAFSPDGRFLASGALHGDGVAVWDVAGARRVQRLHAAGAVAWLPDSTAVVAGRVEPGQPLGAYAGWDPRTGRVVFSVRTAVPAALGMAVSRDGTYLAVQGADRGEVIRLAGQRSLLTLPGRSPSLAFAADDSVVGIDLDGVVRRWAMPSGRPLRDVSAGRGQLAPSRIAITAEGTVFAQAQEPGKILRLKLDGGGPGLPLTGFPGSASDMSFSADGRLLAVVGINSPPMLFRYQIDRLPHPQVVGYMAFDPAGRRLAVGSGDPVVRIWDPRTSSLASTLPLPTEGGPIGLAYGPGGTLAVALSNGTVQLFDPQGKPQITLSAGDGLFASGPAFSPDGSLLAVAVDPIGQNDNEIDLKPGVPDVIVWDLRTGAERARLETPNQAAISVAFAPDGSHLIAAANGSRGGGGLGGTGFLQDGRIWSWRTSDMSLQATRDLPQVGISQLKISPDGKLVAVAAGRRVALFRADTLTPAGSAGPHPVDVRALAFSPDSRMLATASELDDDFARLWDVASGQLVAELHDQGDATTLQFAPDGKTLAVGSGDWVAVLWHLDPDDAVRRLCAIAVPNARNDNLTVPAPCR